MISSLVFTTFNHSTPTANKETSNSSVTSGEEVKDLPKVDGIVWRSGALNRSPPQQRRISVLSHCCQVLYPLRASLIKYFREMCALSAKLRFCRRAEYHCIG